MEKNRIYGEAVDIDHNKVEQFYDSRAQNINNMKNPYSSVMLSDHDPQRVEKRMKIEYETILPKFRVDESSSVLDIGCGIGRFGEKLLPICQNYTGVDFSQKMIDVAKERLSFGGEKVKLHRASFQELVAEFEAAKHTHMLISGVLMYISDSDAHSCLKGLLRFAAEKCIVYISESCGIRERLTLKNFPSEALKTEYNVIFRTKNEYNELLSIFTENGFNTVYSEFYSNLGGDVTFGETDRLYIILERGV